MDTTKIRKISFKIALLAATIGAAALLRPAAALADDDDAHVIQVNGTGDKVAPVSSPSSTSLDGIYTVGVWNGTGVSYVNFAIITDCWDGGCNSFPQYMSAQ